MNGSFFSLFGDDSSLLDFDFFDVLAESILDSLDDVLLISLEGVEVSSSSEFELGVIGIFLDEDGYLRS